MFGQSIGELNVQLLQGGAYTRPIWKRTGNLGDLWRFGHVTVRSDLNFQLVIEGIVGKSYDGDAAIDDTEVLNGPCDPEATCNFEDGVRVFFFLL